MKPIISTNKHWICHIRSCTYCAFVHFNNTWPKSLKILWCKFLNFIFYSFISRFFSINIKISVKIFNSCFWSDLLVIPCSVTIVVKFSTLGILRLLDCEIYLKRSLLWFICRLKSSKILLFIELSSVIVLEEMMEDIVELSDFWNWDDDNSLTARLNALLLINWLAVVNCDCIFCDFNNWLIVFW